MTRIIRHFGIALMALAALSWAGSVRAEQCCSSQGRAQAGISTGAVTATIEGRNYCVGCALKKEGATAQCRVSGHKHAFKVTKAVGVDGQELTELKGWTLHYLDTEKGQELLQQHHGKTFTIQGKIYPQERIVEVESFAVPKPAEG